MKTITIVDGSGYLFRAWYAFPAMYDDLGRNQNVIYGFTRMILKLIFEEESEYFLIARDSPIKTKRHENYPEYKANRQALEDEFKYQIPLVQELIQELAIPNLVAPGYEADDIIATLVANYKDNPECTIKVYSSDKDLKQFLQENVLIIDPIKNQMTRTIDFQKEFGFAPLSIVDYLALVGDSADNIKGVPSIGPKKASFLIQKYGTMENIYTHLAEIPQDLRTKLQVAREEAFFSKTLVQLMMVPEIMGLDLEYLQLSRDLDHREHVLVGKQQFQGMKKMIHEYRKKLSEPQQIWLFG